MQHATLSTYLNLFFHIYDLFIIYKQRMKVEKYNTFPNVSIIELVFQL